jgi:uncharacterized membrane protein
MTRMSVVASSAPQAAGASPNGRGSSRALRRFGFLAATLLLALALEVPTALAAATGETGSTYGATPPPPTTPSTQTTPKPATGTSPSSTKSTPTPSTGTSPSKGSKEKTTPTPTKGVAPATSTSTTAKARTLPFTGLDLRWIVGIGVLLMGTGLSIVMAQRERRQHGR